MCSTPCDPVDCSLPDPLCMVFSRQEHWSGLPCSLPGDLPDPGSNPRLLCFLHWQVGFFTTSAPEKPLPSPMHLYLLAPALSSRKKAELRNWSTNLHWPEPTWFPLSDGLCCKQLMDLVMDFQAELIGDDGKGVYSSASRNFRSA